MPALPPGAAFVPPEFDSEFRTTCGGCEARIKARMEKALWVHDKPGAIYDGSPSCSTSSHGAHTPRLPSHHDGRMTTCYICDKAEGTLGVWRFVPLIGGGVAHRDCLHTYLDGEQP